MVSYTWIREVSLFLCNHPQKIVPVSVLRMKVIELLSTLGLTQATVGPPPTFQKLPEYVPQNSQVWDLPSIPDDTLLETLASSMDMGLQALHVLPSLIETFGGFEALQKQGAAAMLEPDKTNTPTGERQEDGRCAARTMPVDGCGPPGLTVHEPYSHSTIFAHSYFETTFMNRFCFMRYGLGKCCDQHDRCYGTCGKSFQDCEKQFSSCLVDRCENNNVTKFAPNLTPKLCMELGRNLTALSGALGRPFWEKSQKFDCSCPSMQSLMIK